MDLRSTKHSVRSEKVQHPLVVNGAKNDVICSTQHMKWEGGQKTV